jgi:hypothetical protein
MDTLIPWYILKNYNFTNIFWKIDNNLLISNYKQIYKTKFCCQKVLKSHKIEILWIHDKIEDIFYDTTNSILYIHLYKKERPNHIPSDRFDSIIVDNKKSPYGLYILYI